MSKNIKDFKIRQLELLGIVVQKPDRFLLETFKASPEGVAAAFATFRVSLRSNPTPELLLRKLAKDGQRNFAAAVFAASQAGSFML